MTFFTISFQLPIEKIKNLTAKNAKSAKVFTATLCVLRALVR